MVQCLADRNGGGLLWLDTVSLWHYLGDINVVDKSSRMDRWLLSSGKPRMLRMDSLPNARQATGLGIG